MTGLKNEIDTQPAFPHIASAGIKATPGMSKREYFALHILCALLPDVNGEQDLLDATASAYLMADSMCALAGKTPDEISGMIFTDHS